MAQVKKIEIEQAIVYSAYKLFKKHGYNGVKMPQIAAKSGISTANIYVYFKSKLDILIAVYKDWFLKSFHSKLVEIDLTSSPEQILRQLFQIMWQDLPAADNGFCGTLIEALSNRTLQDKYSPELRLTLEAALSQIFIRCLPSLGATERQSIINIMVMAFDGYVLNYHLSKGQVAADNDIEMMCDLISKSQV